MAIKRRGGCALLAALSAVCLLAECGGGQSAVGSKSSSSAALPTAPSSGAVPSAPLTLVGAGDIAMCGYLDGAYQTAALLDSIPGTVFTMGDDAQLYGTADEYLNCYAPTWGRQLLRTRPAPGNHDYLSGGQPYYEYFGERAGPAGLGYYHYTMGAWQVYSLNSEIPASETSPQGEWLRRELASNRSECTLAYWHRPLFSSGKIGNNTDVRDLYKILYDAGAEVVVNGHDHVFERFAPQDPDGRPDPDRGIREFIVGTGGSPLSGIANVKANSESRANTWGVIVFTLSGGSYQWSFMSAGTNKFTDSGAGACH